MFHVSKAADRSKSNNITDFLLSITHKMTFCTFSKAFFCVKKFSPLFPVSCFTFFQPLIGQNSSTVERHDYNIDRKERICDNRGGGVFQAIKNDIFVTHCDDLDTDCEFVGPNVRSKARDQSLYFSLLSIVQTGTT